MYSLTQKYPQNKTKTHVQHKYLNIFYYTIVYFNCNKLSCSGIMNKYKKTKTIFIDKKKESQLILTIISMVENYSYKTMHKYIQSRHSARSSTQLQTSAQIYFIIFKYTTQRPLLVYLFSMANC